MKVNQLTARADIYRHGLRTPASNKQGFTLDRSQPRGIDDQIIVKKGEKYYTWQKRNQPKQISLTYPKRQQLTNSDYLISIYDLEDEIGETKIEDILSPEDLQSLVEDWKTRVEELRDEQEEKKNNMPENLQESPVAEMLQERYDALDNWVNEIDSIDLSDYDEEIQNFVEWAESKLEEVSNVSLE